jgi:methylenetetrahydrofolate reductase (NADPH)
MVFLLNLFFETELLSIYLNRLQGTEVFAGISPVTSQRSIGYWEKVNKVSFPKGFQTNLQYQAELSRDLLKVSESYNQHSYLMPITLSAVEYLRAVFN